MKHLSLLTRSKPAPAQFEPVLQFVGLLHSIFALYQYVSQLFGLPIPQKDSGA